MSTILSYTDYIDWKTFIADKLGEDLRDRYRAVKTVAPEHDRHQPCRGCGAVRVAAITGKASPTTGRWRGRWTTTAHRSIRSTRHSSIAMCAWRGALLDFARVVRIRRRARGFYVGELQAGFGTIALNVSPTVTPEDLRIWTWSALARGAKGINYYAWYPMSSGYESGGFGLIQLDGTITDRARAAGEIARVVDRNQQLFLDARPAARAGADRLQSAGAFRRRTAARRGVRRPTGRGGGHRARFAARRLPRAVPAATCRIDYVHINELSADLLRPYKLVILPYPLMLPEASAAAMKAYVQNGGALVAEARLGWSNERGNASERIPGMGLWEVMGCRETDVQTGAAGRTDVALDCHRACLNAGEVLPARWYEETLEPLSPSARVVATFRERRAGSGRCRHTARARR